MIGFKKKLFHVSWVADFGHAKVNHGAAVIARNAKHAAELTKQYFVIGQDAALKVAQCGLAYVHTTDVKETK